MTPFYSDEWLTLYGGDARTVLPELPADSVDCVVTSPPYWGLRDYGTATWTGGDDSECDHRPLGARRGVERRTSTLDGGVAHLTAQEGPQGARAVCPRCGASRIDSQLGLERTPEEYVANMVAVFAEVRRVLKPSGTCWLNLGDSYNNRTKVRTSSHQPALNDFEDDDWADRAARGGVRMTLPGIKEKDLVGIPWRVAFALQADGWYLRSDIIWSKPNPMPESVTDRPTKSHEYLFLLTKSARYYFDADAVAERSIDPESVKGRHKRNDDKFAQHDPDGFARTRMGFAKIEAGRQYPTRNIRSVWTIATRPYPGAHFAVFPPELPERCIKAGSSECGVCPECGAPWERETVKSVEYISGSGKAGNPPNGKNGKDYGQAMSGSYDIRMGPSVTTNTVGWTPTCPTTCDPVPAAIPAVVLDPFAGSGTVGMVANRLSRRAVLIDLNPEYLKQQMKRNAQTPLGLSA